MRKCRRVLPRTTAALVCVCAALLPGTAYASTGNDALAGPASLAGSSSAEASAGGSGVTTSHYMVLFGSNPDPEQIGYSTGCTDGKSGTSGLRVLFFGTQEANGKLRPPGTTISSKAPRVDEATIERASLGWIKGFTECGSASAVVAVATNNKSDGGVDGADAGARWGKLVERITASAPAGRVTVGGGLDGEPAWSAPAWARGWVDGYVRSSSRGLYVAGSADGCLVGGGERCSNGWTVQDVYHMATGAGSNVYAVPQIYRTDGIQARQWAGISQIARMAGDQPVRFASAMTQQTACRQKPPCPNIDNAPGNAHDQLSKALANPNNLDGSKNVVVPKAVGPKAPDDSEGPARAEGPDSSTGTDSSKTFNGSPSVSAPTPADSSPNAGSSPNLGAVTGVGPAGSGTSAGTGPATAVEASKTSRAAGLGSTDVAWPDDQSALAWVTAQPSVPGGPTG